MIYAVTAQAGGRGKGVSEWCSGENGIRNNGGVCVSDRIRVVGVMTVLTVKEQEREDQGEEEYDKERK